MCNFVITQIIQDCFLQRVIHGKHTRYSENAPVCLNQIRVCHYHSRKHTLNISTRAVFSVRLETTRELARSWLRSSFVLIVPYTSYLAGNELVSSMTKNTISGIFNIREKANYLTIYCFLSVFVWDLN